jgi:hypothetical protein
MRSKKLTVRVAIQSYRSLIHQQTSSLQNNDLVATSEHSVSSDSPGRHEEKNATRSVRLRQAIAFRYINNAERAGFGPTVTVRLVEIGFKSLLPPLAKELGKPESNFLNCEVDTDGRTRLLIVSDDSGSSNETMSINRNLDILNRQIEGEHRRSTELESLILFLSPPTRPEGERGVSPTDVQTEGTFHGDDRVVAVQKEMKQIVDDFPEDNTVTSCHHVVVDIVEAVGLSSSDFIGSCNPYCEVILKGRSRSRTHFLQNRRNLRKTYFLDKSLNPKWRDQAFVFDVPEDGRSVSLGDIPYMSRCEISVLLVNIPFLGKERYITQAFEIRRSL